MIGFELLRYSKRPVIFFDVECSRLNLMDDNKIFQISWLIIDNNKIVKSCNYYLKWKNFRISRGAAAVTKFQQSWVDGGNDPRDVLEEFWKDLNNTDYLIAGHNILMFDVYIVKLWREQFGLNMDWSILDRFYDTNIMAKAYKLNIKPDKDNLLAWSYKMANLRVKGVKTNLTAISKELDIKVDESKFHEALYDLHVNEQVFNKLKWLIEI